MDGRLCKYIGGRMPPWRSHVHVRLAPWVAWPELMQRFASEQAATVFTGTNADLTFGFPDLTEEDLDLDFVALA